MLKEVDTTGCGDALMRYANAVGALTATGQGAVTALPRVDAVAKMIDV